MQAPQAPLIGVIADHKTLNPRDRSDSARLFVGAYATYLRCLATAGALPVVIPLELSSDALRGIFDRLDGVLLTGGGDLDPVLFGESPHPTVAEVDPARDTAELLASRWAAENDVPFLGICRGHQVVNVALGGSLYQDIPSQLSNLLRHDSGSALPLDHAAHTVSLVAGSRLQAILAEEAITTNSRHHQAVRAPGAGLVISAVTADGVVEATENPGARFFLSVQWHPENLCQLQANDSVVTDMTPLFRAFVAAAAAFHHAHLTLPGRA